MNDRLNKLQEKLQEFEVDGLLITNPENRYYISGFTGSAGYLFITPDEAYLNTDFRYIEQATNQAPSFEIVKIDSELKWFIDLLIKHRINTLGFESEDLSFAGYSRFSEIIDKNKLNKIVNLKPLSSTIEKIRAVKYMDEIDILKEAIRISDDEMLNGVSLLASEEGIFAAPEGGAVVSATLKLRENNFIKKSDKVVMVNTGSAYKYLNAMEKKFWDD